MTNGYPERSYNDLVAEGVKLFGPSALPLDDGQWWNDPARILAEIEESGVEHDEDCPCALCEFDSYGPF